MKRMLLSLTIALLPFSAFANGEPLVDVDNTSVAVSDSRSTSTSSVGDIGVTSGSSSSVSGGNNNISVVNKNEAAASSAASLGAQLNSTICSGNGGVSFGAQTIGAGVSFSFKGGDRFCQILLVGGADAAIAYLATVDRASYKALVAAGLVIAGGGATSKNSYQKCEWDGKTLRYSRTPGFTSEQALADCANKYHVKVR